MANISQIQSPKEKLQAPTSFFSKIKRSFTKNFPDPIIVNKLQIRLQFQKSKIADDQGM